MMGEWKSYGRCEACWCYCDMSRAFQIFFREKGDRYSERIGLVGCAQSTPEELGPLMDARVSAWMDAHGIVA